MSGALTFPVLSNTQARQLAGTVWTINGTTYRFKPLDPLHKGQPSWKSGAEGKAYPLLAPDGSIAAYLKCFNKATQKRVDRTAWLIGQQVYDWAPGLAAAPLEWVDTFRFPRPDGIDFDFAGCLSRAVPGQTWLEVKHALAVRETRTWFKLELRWRCIRDLIHSIAILEQAGIKHGDLSPNNIIVDLSAPPDRPALYLIDFDAFVAEAAGTDLSSVVPAEGGTYGTEGYCPPDLIMRASAGQTVVPYSDHYGRDMLILELLCFMPARSPEEPPSLWEPGWLEKRRKATLSRLLDEEGIKAFEHLEAPSVFRLNEASRPKSSELARILEISLPPRPAERPRISIPLTSPTLPLSHPPAPSHSPKGRWRKVKLAWIAAAACAALSIMGIIVMYTRRSSISFSETTASEIRETTASEIRETTASEIREYRVGEVSRFDGHKDILKSETVKWFSAVALSSDGQHALFGSAGDHIVRLWDARSGQLKRFEGHTDHIGAVALSADDHLALSSSSDGTVRLWDTQTGKEVRHFDGHTNSVEAVALSVDGRIAISGSRDDTVRLWDTQTGKEVRRFDGHTGTVEAVALSTDGRRALSGGWDHTVRLWDTQTGKELRRFDGHTSTVEAVALSTDGHFALSGSQDRTVRLWNTLTGEELKRFAGHTNEVEAVSLSLDNRLALSGSRDQTLRLWDTQTGQELKLFRFMGDSEGLYAMALSVRNCVARTSHDDATVRLLGPLNLDPNRPPTVEVKIQGSNGSRLVVGDRSMVNFDGQDPESDPLRFQFRNPNGGDWQTVSVGDGKVFLPVEEAGDLSFEFRAVDAMGLSSRVISQNWKVAPIGETRRFKGHAGYLNDVALSSDVERALSSGGEDNTVRLWDTRTGRELKRFEGHSGRVFGIALSADGLRALTGGQDTTVRLWDTRTGQELKRFEGHSDQVYEVALSADGRQALSASRDNTMLFWDTQTGQELKRFNVFSKLGISIALSADGRRALSGGLRAMQLSLWDTQDGRELKRFDGLIDGAKCVALSGDGRRALSGSEHDTVQLWDTITGKELARFETQKRNILLQPGSVPWYTHLALSLSFDGRRALLADAYGTCGSWTPRQHEN